MVLKKIAQCVPRHHAVPESAYFKVPETLKTFHMYPISTVRLCFALAGNPTKCITANQMLCKRQASRVSSCWACVVGTGYDAFIPA